MSCSSCNCSPCTCGCVAVDANNEVLVSQVNNLIISIFGSVTKSVSNGQVIWTLPCDLSAGISGFPRGANEGTNCYLLRLFSYLNGVVSGFVSPVPISNGGTGATTAAAALTALGGIGAATTDTLTNKTFTNAGNTRQTLTDAATIAWDASLGSCAVVALAANRAMGAPTNLKVGTYILETTGAFGITSWNAIFKWASGTAPTAGGVWNAYTFYYNGTNLIGTAVTSIS